VPTYERLTVMVDVDELQVALAGNTSYRLVQVMQVFDNNVEKVKHMLIFERERTAVLVEGLELQPPPLTEYVIEAKSWEDNSKWVHTDLKVRASSHKQAETMAQAEFGNLHRFYRARLADVGIDSYVEHNEGTDLKG
jgi:hypothetical protein